MSLTLGTYDTPEGAMKYGVLSVPKKYQYESEWCWAACAEMVLHYHGQTNWSQPKIVEHIYGSPNSNRFTKLPDIYNFYSACGITPDVKFGNNKQDPMPFIDLKSAINQERPVEAYVCWNCNAPANVYGHLLIVYGWGEHQEDKYAFVHDPRCDGSSGPIKYSDLCKYDGGTWHVAFVC